MKKTMAESKSSPFDKARESGVHLLDQESESEQVRYGSSPNQPNFKASQSRRLMEAHSDMEADQEEEDKRVSDNSTSVKITDTASRRRQEENSMHHHSESEASAKKKVRRENAATGMTPDNKLSLDQYEQVPDSMIPRQDHVGDTKQMDFSSQDTFERRRHTVDYEAKAKRDAIKKKYLQNKHQQTDIKHFDPIFKDYAEQRSAAYRKMNKAVGQTPKQARSHKKQYQKRVVGLTLDASAIDNVQMMEEEEIEMDRAQQIQKLEEDIQFVALISEQTVDQIRDQLEKKPRLEDKQRAVQVLIKKFLKPKAYGSPLKKKQVGFPASEEKLKRRVSPTMSPEKVNAKYSRELIDPEDPVFVERELMRFKPGLSANYVSRWVQLTKNVFRYYRNFYHSASSFSKPLVALPFSSIQDVQKVKVKTNVLSSDQSNYQEAPFHQHQFELLLKEDYETLHFVDRISKMYDKQSPQKTSEIKKRLLQAFSSPQKIIEEEDEEGSDKEEKKVDPFEKRGRKLSVDKSLLARLSTPNRTRSPSAPKFQSLLTTHEI